MPLDTIYLTRHGHRLNWTIDYKTGTYKAQFPTPTGNPADPILTSHGVRQSHELAAHVVSPGFQPKPFRVYSSPFYRCLQTIQPAVEALKAQQHQGSDIDPHADLDVRIENGLGEWFGSTSFFHHPPPADPTTLHTHFPTILPSDASTHSPHLLPSPRGETIAQLHDRVATALAGIIADADSLIAALEADLPEHQRGPKALLVCSHAAPLIAMGRVLTGRMPADSAEEDFFVFTAGLSTFRRRVGGGKAVAEATVRAAALAEGTRMLRPETVVPDWQGRGVGGGWECISNGDCSFLSGGAERGWHFNGEESFDTGPMSLSSGKDSSPERFGGKL